MFSYEFRYFSKFNSLLSYVWTDIGYWKVPVFSSSINLLYNWSLVKSDIIVSNCWLSSNILLIFFVTQGKIGYCEGSLYVLNEK